MREVLPATSPASKDTPNEKRNETMVFPATTQASKDTPVKKRRESERERERERERKRGAPSYETSIQGHTKEERGAEKEESTEILRLQQVPMDLKLALTAVVTLCPAEMAGCFDRCGHVQAIGLEFQR